MEVKVLQSSVRSQMFAVMKDLGPAAQGKKMPSPALMAASIHPEAVVRIKWALLSTNLILLRAAVSQHFNSSWEKATGKGPYSRWYALLIIIMVTFK